MLERIQKLHKWSRRKAGAALLAVIAAAYKAAQELKYVPSNVFVFPLLVVAVCLLVFYILVTSDPFVALLGGFYGYFHKRNAVMYAYLIVIAMGAVLGGTGAGVGLKLFRLHSEHMKRLASAPNTNHGKADELAGSIKQAEEKPPTPPVLGGKTNIATPILKSPPKSSPPTVIGPRLGIGPEAYKEISDEQVGQWAMEEADKIEELAKGAINYWGGVRAGVSFNAISWRFTNEFNDCCTQDLKELRTEVLRRLGAPAKDPEEILAWTALFPELKYPELKEHGVPERINLASVEYYAPYLRRLGLQLKRRQIPRVAPIALQFSETQVPPQPPSNFPYNLIVTVKTEKKATAGYIIVEFDGHPGSIACDFIDSKLVIGSDARIIDNKEVREYAGKYEPPNYTLAIGKTPFTPEKPVHVIASGGPKPFHVVKVTLFDE